MPETKKSEGTKPRTIKMPEGAPKCYSKFYKNTKHKVCRACKFSAPCQKVTV